MAKKALIGGLEVRLLTYFMLIVVAALMIGLEFVMEMNGDELKQQLWTSIGQPQGQLAYAQADASVFAPLADFRDKIVVMFAVLTLVTAIVLIMFMSNITAPLQKMVDTARQINEGDLSQVLEVQTRDEIGELGKAINELTSNLQELAAIAKHAGEAMASGVAAVKGDVAGLAVSNACQERLLALDQEARSLVEVIDSFQLLETQVGHFKPREAATDGD